MQVLRTSDYRGIPWPVSAEEEDEGYPLYVLHFSNISPRILTFAFTLSPLVMKVRSRASSILSGASTPGGGKFKSLSEGDLRKADAALSHVVLPPTPSVSSTGDDAVDSPLNEISPISAKGEEGGEVNGVNGNGDAH